MIAITRTKRGYTLETEQVLPHAIDAVFPFFADAFNLEKITPPFIRFRVETPPPIEMRVGTMIDYRLRLHGIPVRWRSEITAWEPPHYFVDEQRIGPYRHWRHEHSFEAAGVGTRMRDRVEYSVPGGAIVHWLFVRRDVEHIFGYRRQLLERLLDPRLAESGS